MKNRRGFTLIELLAVIVILGVILGIAIPKVSGYITGTKKDSLVSAGKLFIDGVRNDITRELYPAPINKNDVTIITLDKIKIEKSNKKSPFGGKYLYNKSYVAVINVGDGTDPNYKYFFAAQDTKDYAMPLTAEDKLDSSLIVAKAKNKMEVTIQSLCGTEEGQTGTYAGISGLSEYGSGWNATIFSSSECGKSGE